MVHVTFRGMCYPQVCESRMALLSDGSLISYLWSGWEPQPNPGLSACDPAPDPEACPALLTQGLRNQGVEDNKRNGE